MANIVSIHRQRSLPLVGAADRLAKAKKPSAKEPLVISASELRDFLRCRVKWSWRHHHQIVPRELRNNNLPFGGLVHEILEKYYGLEKRSVKGMRKVAKQILQNTKPDQLSLEDLELAQAMAMGYAGWAKERDDELKMANVQPEQWFEHPLTEDRSIIVRGKMDVVFEPKLFKRTMGAMEHKTKAQISVDMVDMNLQLSVYLWALRRLYPKYRRYIAFYNVLRKQMPGPRVKAALFAREPVERMDDEIEQWALDTQRAVLDMLDCAIYPNPMDACSWDCDYQQACMMRGRPDDLNHVLKRDFMRKDGTPLSEKSNGK